MCSNSLYAIRARQLPGRICRCVWFVLFCLAAAATSNDVLFRATFSWREPTSSGRPVSTPRGNCLKFVFRIGRLPVLGVRLCGRTDSSGNFDLSRVRVDSSDSLAHHDRNVDHRHHSLDVQLCAATTAAYLRPAQRSSDPKGVLNSCSSSCRNLDDNKTIFDASDAPTPPDHSPRAVRFNPEWLGATLSDLYLDVQIRMVAGPAEVTERKEILVAGPDLNYAPSTGNRMLASDLNSLRFSKPPIFELQESV